MLLTILLIVAATAWVDRSRAVSWRRPLEVGVFPIVGDDSPATAAWVDALTEAQLQPVASFLADEAARHGLGIEPVRLRLAPRVRAGVPARGGDTALANVIWSLKLRWYASRRTAELEGVRPTVRLFVIYHDPARTVKVPHSAGLSKGMIGVVHAFAGREQQGGNGIVIAHELLHTVGASDKYDEAGLPRWPEGYADPQQQPRFPQRRAEVMAGRRALDSARAEMPDSLDDVVVGEATAREIRWLP